VSSFWRVDNLFFAIYGVIGVPSFLAIGLIREKLIFLRRGLSTIRIQVKFFPFVMTSLMVLRFLS